MTMNLRDKDFESKKESESDYSKFPMISSSSRQWSSSFKNPRIVRVSRTFGGKDRHSKVCTVRGLRDRRIRLSVPTAIQLYDLQDRLGLSQPSKVVDWLIDATKLEIDKLPPLPSIPITNFAEFHQPTLASYESSNLSQGMVEKNKWFGSQHQQDQNEEGFGGFVAQLSAQNFFPLSSQFSAPYNSSCFQWDPPSLSLSQFGGGYSFSTQAEEQSHSSLLTTLPSSSQLYACPHAATVPSITPPFPSYIPSSVENDHLRLINQLQNVQQNSILPTTLHLISSPVKSFSLSMDSLTVHSHEHDNTKQDKDKRSS